MYLLAPPDCLEDLFELLEDLESMVLMAVKLYYREVTQLQVSAEMSSYRVEAVLWRVLVTALFRQVHLAATAAT